MPKGLALTINYGQEKALMWALRAEVWVSTCLWRGRSFLFTSSLLLITLETGRVPRRAGETLAPKLWDGGRISRNDLPVPPQAIHHFRGNAARPSVPTPHFGLKRRKKPTGRNSEGGLCFKNCILKPDYDLKSHLNASTRSLLRNLRRDSSPKLGAG